MVGDAGSDCGRLIGAVFTAAARVNDDVVARGQRVLALPAAAAFLGVGDAEQAAVDGGGADYPDAGMVDP
jgi:hypothetical protein